MSLWGTSGLLAIDAAAQISGYRADLLESLGAPVPKTWNDVFELAAVRPGFVSVALLPVDALMCFFTLCANAGEEPFRSGDQLISPEAGQHALAMLLQLRDVSIPEAIAANPIAIWEKMSTSDDIAYCPLAFGYSNYARSGYRPRLLWAGAIPSAGKGATLGGAGLAICSIMCQPAGRRGVCDLGRRRSVPANPLCGIWRSAGEPRRLVVANRERTDEWLFPGDPAGARIPAGCVRAFPAL